MSRMMCLLLPLLCMTTLLAQEDLPLGILKVQADKSLVTAEFQSAHGLLPDDMVAIFGPGKVEKHPLTNQVTTEYRKQVAKAHVIKVTAKTLTAKVTFLKDDVILENGFDVIPMPGEASPDAPPVINGKIEDIVVDGQQTVTVHVPIKDPEGQPLGITWSLKGEAGNTGRLSAQTSGTPEIVWSAPGHASSGAIVAVAVDPLGQKLQVEIPFVSGEVSAEYRKRALKPFATFGGTSGLAYNDMVQAHNGEFWAIGADGRSIIQLMGWSSPQVLEVASEANLRQPKAVFPFGRELFVLDGGSRSVMVIAAGGQLQRQFGALKSPTDLTVTSDGTVLVADQQSGGVQVFEKDGTFRATLGRSGTGVDSFSGLTRVCVDKEDNCYALDAGQRMVLRFDRFHRRLDTWTIQGDPQIKLMDIKAHPLGLLILQSNGQVLIHTEQGLSGNAMPSPIDSGLVDRLTEPSSLISDRTGRVYVTYPREGVIVRYNKQGKLFGVRGPSLWKYNKVVADGRGWHYGLNTSNGFVYAHDDEGWRVFRFGGMERDGGPFQRPHVLAVAHNGSAVVVGDQRRMALERFNMSDQGKSKITFGQQGTNNGQFKEISAICMDDSGFTYIADEDNHRVSVFNEEGNFLYNFGNYERGRTAGEIVRPQFICVNAAGTICYIYDGKKYEIQKFELNLGDGIAKHVTNGGGRGKAMGQVSRPVGLGCDRFGLLYLLDSGRRDLQILDFRGNNLVGIATVDMNEYNMSSVDALALNPDGLPTIGARGQFMSMRWEKP